MDINLEWDADAVAAPQSFRDSVQAAADVLDAALSDPITVNVAVGYGEYGLGTPQYQALNGNYSLGGIQSAIAVSYPALLAALGAHETSSTQAELLQSLPQAASLNSTSTFYVSDAQAKALGALAAAGTEVDGYAGFPTSFTGSALTATAIVEIVHALGLLNGGSYVESLDSYTSPGVHYFGKGNSAYFSLDGGATPLASYDVGFDSTLFTGVPTAVLNVPTSATSLSMLDLEQLSADGFDTGSPAALPALSAVLTTGAMGHATAVTGQNVSVPVGQAISAISMVQSVAVPAGDDISTYVFSNDGADGGTFSIDGVTMPIHQPITVLATQLGQLHYTGPATAGTDTVSVYALAGNKGSQSYFTGSSTVTAFASSTSPYIVNDLSDAPSAAGANHFIDLPNFEASYPDLIRAFGTDTQAMADWYARTEPVENRAETFNGLDYIASYKDLINAFGQPGVSAQTLSDEGATHFISSGLPEGRSTTFNALDYIASYADLTRAFGRNADAGAMHFIDGGVNEGRSVSFDGLDYIASYRDLISAFGANEQAGAAHYIQSGINEGRQVSFDGLAYIANYTDLMRAFGANNDAGATHYIQSGINEGRTTTFDVQGYEAAHPDLAGVYSSNDAFLKAYINTYVSTGHYLT